MNSTLRLDLAIHRNGLRRDERGSALLAAGYEVLAETRQALRRRVEVLSADLDRRSPKQIAVIVSELMAKFVKRTSEADAKQSLSAYVEVLQDVPPWCVAEACHRFAHGLVAGHNNAFPPTAPELYQEALKIVQPWRTERAEICELLQAPVEKVREPPTDAQKARVDALMAQFAAEVQESQRRQKAERAAADAARDDALAKYRPPPRDRDDLTPSEELLKTLKVDA